MRRFPWHRGRKCVPAALTIAWLLATVCLCLLGSTSVVHVPRRGFETWCSSLREEHSSPVEAGDSDALQEEARYFANLDPDFARRNSDLAIYSLKEDQARSQRFWEFRNVCFNGSNLVVFGKQTCRDGTSFFPDGPVAPVSCNLKQYWQDHSTARETGFGPVTERPLEWLDDRNVTWHNGTSCLINLERATTNVAHLHARVNVLLLMNQATLPAFSDVISRFLFRIAPEGLGQYLEPDILSRGIANPYHATYLAEVLWLVNLRALEGRRLPPSHILGARSAASGRVEFNGSMADASEQQPVCFQKALLPGILKASYWPGGVATADQMRRRLYKQAAPTIHQALMPPSIPLFDASIHLLYILRNNTGTFKRRQFDPASARTMLSAVAATGLYWRAVELVGMDFWQQVALVKDAGISISLHGANLLNPSLMQRKGTVLVELIPFKVVHHMYEEQAMASGLIYMGMRLERGSVQWLDDRYANLSSQQCMGEPLCKMYHVHNRTVELTRDDGERIRMWLLLARNLVRQMPVLRLQPLWDAPMWQQLASMVPGSPGSWWLKVGDCGRAADIRRSRRLGQAWITFKDHQGFKTCNWILEPRSSLNR